MFNESEKKEDTTTNENFTATTSISTVEKEYEISENVIEDKVLVQVDGQMQEINMREVNSQESEITKEKYPLLQIVDQMSCHHRNSVEEKKDVKLNLVSNNENKYDNENNLLYKTDICCWWCCHSFNWEPFMLPVDYKSGIFEVVGYFSSPECVAAFIFEQGSKYGDIYKQYSLLHLLYSKNVNGEISKIKLALPRETLKMFGGPYSIDKYRRLCDNYYMDVKIIRQPFIPSNGIAEESMSEYINKRKFIPLDKERVQKATEELKLKRLKKKGSENTLDKFMNLKVL